MSHEVLLFDADDPIIKSLLDEIDTGTKVVEQDLDNLYFATRALLSKIEAITLE